MTDQAKKDRGERDTPTKKRKKFKNEKLQLNFLSIQVDEYVKNEEKSSGVLSTKFLSNKNNEFRTMVSSWLQMKEIWERQEAQLESKDKIVKEKLQKYADTISYHRQAITDKQTEFEEMKKKRDQAYIDETIFNTFSSEIPDIPMVDI